METIQEMKIIKINKEFEEEALDSIIAEKTINIFINFEFYAALMCTPFEIKELAAGFLFSEGIIDSKESIKSIEEKYGDRVCIILNKDIEEQFDGSLKALTSGCARGSIKLEYLERGSIRAVEKSCQFSSDAIFNLMKEFNSKSELFKKTGGVHSCCLSDENDILIFSEDIGRHNALDKVIGKALMNGMELKNKIMMTTGRISSDIVIKAAKAGIGVIVSHSAPSDMAVNIAKDAGMTLIGFVRGRRMNIYSGGENIKLT